MSPRFDGYYRSYLVKHENRHAGVHMIDYRVHYLRLFNSGLWLRKFHTSLDLDFFTYNSAITDEEFQGGLAGRHPHDKEYGFIHQTGRFTQCGDCLEFELAIHLGELNIVRWHAHAESAEILQLSYGATYFFQPAR